MNSKSTKLLARLKFRELKFGQFFLRVSKGIDRPVKSSMPILAMDKEIAYSFLDFI